MDRAISYLLAGLAIATLIIVIIFVVYKPGVEDFNTGIRGDISYRPTQPVCRENVTCSEPYIGSITINGKNFQEIIMTDENGHFEVNLSAGIYTVNVNRNFISDCGKEAEVKYGQYTYISIECDTGIR